MELLKPFEVASLSIKQARKIYQQLRKTAIRRLARIEKAGKGSYIESSPGLEKSRKLTDDEIFAEIKEVNRFLKNPYSSINKIKQFENYMIEKLNASGYDFVNKSNITRINFMLGKIKEIIPSELWDSDEALEMIEQTERLNIDPVDFEKNIDKFMELDPLNLEKIKPIKTGREMTFKDIMKRLGK